MTGLNFYLIESRIWSSSEDQWGDDRPQLLAYRKEDLVRLCRISVEIIGLCILDRISLWHGFLYQNEIKWWMDCCVIFSDFVLESMCLGYLDLINSIFLCPVRPICLIPDIGSTAGGIEEGWGQKPRQKSLFGGQNLFTFLPRYLYCLSLQYLEEIVEIGRNQLFLPNRPRQN